MLYSIETAGKKHLSLFIQYMESVCVCVCVCALDALTARVMANREAAAAAAQQIVGVDSSDAGASVM
jgi:hypothetical protein